MINQEKVREKTTTASRQNNKTIPSKEEIEKRKQIWIHRRVVLDRMDDVQAPPKGTQALIIDVDDIGDLICNWDEESGLKLILNEDEFHIIESVDEIKESLSNLYTVLCVVVVVVGIAALEGVMMGIRPFVMISESMHPEVTKGSLMLLDTRSNVTDVAVGDNVAYVLGKVEAMHKVVSVDEGELVVRSLADDGETTVTASLI